MSVVVVGLGPAGTIATWALARAGHVVTAIDAGTSGSESRAPLAAATPTVRSTVHEEAVRAPVPQAGRDGIGGSKLLAAPQSYRLDPWTLRMRTRVEARHGAGVLPPGTDVRDWPLDPADLHEWYERVEHLLRVGPRPPTEWTRRMAAAARTLGLQPFAAPAAASRDTGVLLGQAVATGRVTTMPGTTVLEVLTDRSGVAGVRVHHEGRIRTVTARAVVLAGSVLANVRLLLLSGLGGPAVGRYFMSHNFLRVRGHFPGVDLDRGSAGPATATAVAEYDADGIDCTREGFVGGSILQAAMTGPAPSPDPEWGAVWAQPEQLPHRDNAIDLDPVAVDVLGRPVARLTFALHDDDHRRARRLQGVMRDWLVAAGAAITAAEEFAAHPLGTHLYGGARMGTDPQTSVVDGYGRVHGVPGLVVTGTATFPTCGGRGPVQTVEALAWRSATALAAGLR